MAPEPLALAEDAANPAGDNIDISQLSFEERIAHKNWKVRLEAYKELTRLFHLAPNSKDSIFREYWEAVKKAPLEQNAAAQESAFVFVVSFLKCSDLALKSRPSLVGPLVEKGLLANKASSKANVLEALMLLIEAETATPVIEEMIQILGNSIKQQKLVLAILSAIKEVVKAFGCQVVPWKIVVKKITGETYFGHADKNIRQEAMNLVIEIHRWIKDVVFGHLEGLRPVQMKEIQEQCAQNLLMPTPSRWLLSQKPEIDDKPEAEDIAEQTGEPAIPPSKHQTQTTSYSELVAVADDYETANPVDVLAQIQETFYEAMSSTKWKDRKDALDGLLAIVKVPRAQEGRFGELIQLLCRHIQTDSNILVVIAAANCIGAITKSLRNSIKNFKMDTMIPALLERCKEKKANVLDALRDALDAQVLGFSGSLIEILDCISGFLSHKNPSVKNESLLWLSRIFSKNGSLGKQLSKKDLSKLSNLLIPLMDDSNTEVRDSAAQVFGSLIALHGENAIIPLIASRLDKIKLSKITANLKPSGESVESVKPPTASISQSKKPIEPPKKKEPAQPEKKVIPQGNAQSRTVNKSDPVYKFSEGDAIAFFNSNYPSQYANLGDASWKTRLDAISSISLPSTVEPELAVRIISHRPGWKDSNVMVIAKAIEVLLKYSGNFNLESVSLILTCGLIEKISEAKLQKDIYSLLDKCAENLGTPSRIFSQILTLILMIKSPKSSSDTIKYLQSLVLDYGQGAIPLQSLPSEVSIIKQLILNSNPLIRSAAIELAAILKGFYGNRSIREPLSDLPNAILSTLDDEFSKISSQLEPRKRSNQEKKRENQMTSSASTGMVMEDSFPRSDETAALSGNVLSKVNDPSWKVRKEGLDELTNIVDGKKITCASDVLGELISGLKNRFTDSNKNIVIQAIEVSGKLMEALPYASLDKGYIKGPFVQAVCSCLSDNKIQVRNSSVSFLQKISKLVPGMVGVLREELKCDSPNAKKEIFSLITEIFESRGLCPEDGNSPDLITTAIIGCLQDRNGDVRKAAQSTLQALAGVIGIESIEKVCQKSAPSLLSSLSGMLTKEKGAKLATKTRLPQKSSTESVTTSSNIFINSSDECKRARLEHDKNLPLGFWTLGDGAFSTENKLKELASQIDGAWSPNFVNQLLSADTKEQNLGLSAIKSLISSIPHSKEENAIINNLDLLLKYFTVKLPEGSLAFFTRFLDIIEETFSLLDNANYRLNDAEINLFLPVFVAKSSVEGGRDSLKSRIKSIHRQLCRVYPASRILGILLDLCKSSKSSKMRSECLEEIIALVGRNGSSVLITPNKQLPVIASLVADKDSSCRNFVLTLLIQIFEILGEETFYKSIGESLTGKELDMFQEKLKRKDQLPILTDGQATSKSSSIMSTPVKKPGQFVEEKVQVEEEEEHQLSEEIENNELEVQPDISASVIENENDLLHQQSNNNFNFLYRRNGGATPFEEHPLDHLIDLIGCTADLQCINSMQKIEEYLQKKEPAVQTRLESLVHALVIRLKEACGSELPLDNDPEILSNKAKLTKFIVNSVLIILGEPELVNEVEKLPEVYQLLLEETVRALLGKRVEQEFGPEERDTVQKSLNLLLVKSLESVPPNLAFRYHSQFFIYP
jgi:cytoskeleton-associated protein 5